ncbi:MAG: GNAT family N-acetyltransferase [Aquabacterium sp.]
MKDPFTQPTTAFPDAQIHQATLDGHTLLTSDGSGQQHHRWSLEKSGDKLQLSPRITDGRSPDEAHWLAALEAAFVHHPHQARIRLDGITPPQSLIDTGAIRANGDGQTIVSREAFWQSARSWLPKQTAPYIQQFALTEGRRHPLRPPKPHGTVYKRHLPWLGQVLSLRVIDAKTDLPVFHRWMNDPVVAKFWQEEGDLAKHQAYIKKIAADPHALGLIGCFDDEPFGYFEAYWAKEDRIAPFYDAHDFDRGWHVLIGEERFRGKPWLTAWMPSISHYLFLDDCRTQRIVIEPRADNDKMIRSLGRCGYALLKEFDFPHKRAMLGMLLRERFFSEALWIPKA